MSRLGFAPLPERRQAEIILGAADVGMYKVASWRRSYEPAAALAEACK